LTLREPRKNEYQKYRQEVSKLPYRRAFAILHQSPGGVIEVVVNLDAAVIEEWKRVEDAVPLLTLEDLDIIGQIGRSDPRVIEACRKLGICDMSKVYFDAWSIGLDKRWDRERRLQQALPYYRFSPNDNQYAHPLAFTFIADTESREILSVDIICVDGDPIPMPLEEHNYHPALREPHSAFAPLKPIQITQPNGVSFKMKGNVLSWAGYRMHVGFNVREGIVLSDISFYDRDEGRHRPLFYRLSVAKTEVPYGCPKVPHPGKQAFDLGEYGLGLMTNSLRPGCDFKGAIKYIDAVMADSQGDPYVVRNAICIHEEDNGILFKHTDCRAGKVVSARDRKLIISQIVTAANYDYCFYHSFTLDGTYELEVKLTGILNTTVLHPTNLAQSQGTKVARSITAHNKQHVFSLRVDPEVDGANNMVMECDARPSLDATGAQFNPYGDAFVCQKSPVQGSSDAALGRWWEILNPARMNPVCGTPVGYKIINSQYAGLLAQTGSNVHGRAAFAAKPIWVVRYEDHEFFTARDYIHHPGNQAIEGEVALERAEASGDIVVFVQFGVTHLPRKEDFPIMPSESAKVTLRASDFFSTSPALWIASVADELEQDRNPRSSGRPRTI
jgi:primary-amine oxidase